MNNHQLRKAAAVLTAAVLTTCTAGVAQASIPRHAQTDDYCTVTTEPPVQKSGPGTLIEVPVHVVCTRMPPDLLVKVQLWRHDPKNAFRFDEHGLPLTMKRPGNRTLRVPCTAAVDRPFHVTAEMRAFGQSGKVDTPGVVRLQC